MTCWNSSDLHSSVVRSWRNVGSNCCSIATAIAICMAVGNTSLDDCPMLTSSLGCNKRSLPIPPPINAEPRLASTSFMFILVCVPLPVCQTDKGNSESHRPAIISSAAFTIAAALSSGSLPRSRLTMAQARLTCASAMISASGMRSFEMEKKCSERCV